MENGELRLPRSKLRDIRLVVCDMDGTALNSSKELEQELLNTWGLLREAGIRCTIASARTPGMLGVFCKQAGFCNVPVITLEGALITNWPAGELLYECPMEPVPAKKIIEYCHSEGLDYTIYTSRRAYLRKNTKRGWRFEKYNALADRYGAGHIETAAFEEVSTDQIVSEKVYKVFLENPGEKAEPLRDFLKKTGHVRSDCSEGSSVTVLREGVSKGTALKKLLWHLEISPEQVCCFGDWFNDLDMLAAVPHSVAMGNAAPEVKRTARYVTKTNDENGVSFFIRQYILDGADDVDEYWV